MRMFNVAKAGVLLLCILLALCALCGCANGDETVISKEELKEIEQNWDGVINNETGHITKIELRAYEVQPSYSSTIKPSRGLTVENESSINALLNALDCKKTKWKSMQLQSPEYKEYLNNTYGKQEISLLLYDSQNQLYMRIIVLEDNTGEIYYEPKPLSGTNGYLWDKYYFVTFSDNVYDALETVFLNLEQSK